MTLDSRLYATVAAVFGVPVESVTGETSPDTIETWDSARHIQLVLALEAEFAVEFDPDEIPELNSVALIRARLARDVHD